MHGHDLAAVANFDTFDRRRRRRHDMERRAVAGGMDDRTHRYARDRLIRRRAERGIGGKQFCLA